MTTTCPYCEEPVPDAAYERHLRREHEAELSAIDRRRVGSSGDQPSGSRLALYAGVGIVLALVAVAYVVLVFAPGPAASEAAIQPDTAADVHEHGTIDVVVDGESVSFDDPQYLERDGCFHFHGYDDAEIWHTHCGDVTIEYALETLGMDVTTDGFAVGDRTFDAADGDDVSVTVDGEPVDPRTYVLEGVGPVDDARDGEGDHVEIVVESGS